jgi:hypothetical protein
LLVYVIERNYQPSEIDAAEAASRFIGWLADAANPVLAELISCWLWGPPDSGGLGALAESAADITLLRGHVTAAWLRPGDRADRQASR